MQVLLLKLTVSTWGCCEMLFATECRGFHAAERGDGVSALGSPHRAALSRSVKRLRLCVRPGLGEKDHIIAPWPMALCSPAHHFSTTRKCHGLFLLFVFRLFACFNSIQRFSFLIMHLSWTETQLSILWYWEDLVLWRLKTTNKEEEIYYLPADQPFHIFLHALIFVIFHEI